MSEPIGTEGLEGEDVVAGVPFSVLSKTVAIDILVHGARSRAQLTKSMGLSAATLTRLVKPLLEAGVLVETDPIRRPGRGRASLALDVVADSYRFVGVKLTTDSIYAVVTDLRSQVLETHVRPVPSLEAADVVEAVGEIVAELRSRTDRPLDAVGVTVGGAVDAGEIVADSPFMHWHDVALKALLSKRLDIPVHLDNDVVGLTQAQHWFGYGRGCADFALFTVGAGIGYGLVLNNEMIPTGVLPVSHLPIDPSGPLCHLGHRGCTTAYLTSNAVTSAVSAVFGRSVGYDEVVSLAAAGEPVARRVVDEAAGALGQAAAAITSLTGVRRIILSGEGIHLAVTARQALEDGLNRYAGPRGSRTELVIRPMDFLEWARGAATIAIQGEFPCPPATRRPASS
ncbi:ROK family protein [Kribbella shirazensis]|uniref:Putative NBD/HSP70 family sugar kinase n=1 Tax=Kribbella shirazensis TaxID=1105143 RepID=A0A7X5VJJ8_9ACTN|nr:putative NBD/HSP70 family sugar kinase [Kribbella shirazensis]